MPADYEAVKKSIRRQNPDMPEDEVKRQAARITNYRRKKAGRPPAKFHR